jgi:hypothetical protein
MQQLNPQQTSVVSGAGVLTETVKVGASAGSALGGGLVNLGGSALQAGTIVAKPLVSSGKALLKFLI